MDRQHNYKKKTKGKNNCPHNNTQKLKNDRYEDFPWNIINRLLTTFVEEFITDVVIQNYLDAKITSECLRVSGELFP